MKKIILISFQLLLLIFFFGYFFAEDAYRYIFIERFSPFQTCKYAALIKEGKNCDVELKRFCKGCIKYSFCSAIIPDTHRYDKKRKVKKGFYHAGIIMYITFPEKDFNELFKFCNELKLISAYIEFNKDGRESLTKEAYGELLPLEYNEYCCIMVITVCEGNSVKQIFLNSRQGIFFSDYVVNKIKRTISGLSEDKKEEILCSIGFRWRLIHNCLGLDRKYIGAFTIEEGGKKHSYTYCKLLKLANFKKNYPEKVIFFWRPKKLLKFLSMVKFINYNKEDLNLDKEHLIEEILNRIVKKNINNRIAFNDLYFKLKDRSKFEDIKLDESELLLSIVYVYGGYSDRPFFIEYYKLKKSDPDVKKLLKIVYEKMKEEKGK